MYAPRAQNPTKNSIQSTTTGKMLLNTRRYFERFDKGKQSNKIVENKKMLHRIGGGKRKLNAGFVTFKE